MNTFSALFPIIPFIWYWSLPACRCGQCFQVFGQHCRPKCSNTAWNSHSGKRYRFWFLWNFAFSPTQRFRRFNEFILFFRKISSVWCCDEHCCVIASLRCVMPMHALSRRNDRSHILDSDSGSVPKFLNPGPAIFQIWESDSCSNACSHRCDSNSTMFVL